MYKFKNKVCNQECRKGLTKVKDAEEKGRWEMVRSKKDNGRRCLVCGVNCWPNYFYCNRHMREDEYGI
jgi:hypothetical protein